MDNYIKKIIYFLPFMNAGKTLAIAVSRSSSTIPPIQIVINFGAELFWNYASMVTPFCTGHGISTTGKSFYLLT